MKTDEEEAIGKIQEIKKSIALMTSILKNFKKGNWEGIYKNKMAVIRNYEKIIRQELDDLKNMLDQTP
jgi:hypothetical protein